MKKRIAVLSGAGISAESGVTTFRDSGGLWEGHDIMEVASIEGWYKNPQLVLDFYNKRRAQLHEVSPNKAHVILAELESHFTVDIITQNVDDLHERAGSSCVLHLHGELLKARSTSNENYIIEWTTDLHSHHKDPWGSPLRPHIVWFGEQVSALEEAIKVIQQADYLIIVGTSLQVYPAAGLVHYYSQTTPIYYIDPNPSPIYDTMQKIESITMNATQGMQYIRDLFLSQ